MAVVVVAYIFFATHGTMRFPPAPEQPDGWDNPGRGYYAELAEGFLRGNTYLAVAPDERLAALRDPYDYGARDRNRISYLWDASYYRGRYYLYFTPLPVVLFYLPFRLITGHHAADTMAGAFFSVWIFIAALFFLRRARIDRPLWIVFLGLANLLPFALSSVRVYEVAILCAAAFSTTWAAALLRFDQTPSSRAAAWMSLWLSLAIVARPNLIVLALPTAILLLRQKGPLRWRVMLAAAIPVVLTAGGYMAYNAARFGNVLESGITYQLTYVPMRGLRFCGVCNAPEAFRMVNNALQYQFTPPRLAAGFPHAEAATAHIDKSVSWPGGEPEEIVGMVPLAPLTLAGVAFAALLLASRHRAESRARAGVSVLGGAWLVLLALSTCWWIVSRYAFDFQILMLLGTVLCVEEGLVLLDEWSLPIRPFRITAALLALYSITLAILLGLEGRAGAFRTQNRPLMEAIGRAISVDVRQ
jgi:hypothetical protein